MRVIDIWTAFVTGANAVAAAAFNFKVTAETAQFICIYDPAAIVNVNDTPTVLSWLLSLISVRTDTESVVPSNVGQR